MKFSFEQTIPLPRRTVFGFFQNPASLAVLHEGWSPLRLLKHETQISVGCETWVEQRIAGFVPVVLGFRHTLFEPPLRFAEQLIHGPFSKFHHLHEFLEDGAKTQVRDLLDVEWPWQFGGRLVLNQLLGPSIAKMFRSRAQAMERLSRDGTVERCATNHRVGNAC